MTIKAHSLVLFRSYMSFALYKVSGTVPRHRQIRDITKCLRFIALGMLGDSAAQPKAGSIRARRTVGWEQCGDSYS